LVRHTLRRIRDRSFRETKRGATIIAQIGPNPNITIGLRNSR
jgi:hypothetical protein